MLEINNLSYSVKKKGKNSPKEVATFNQDTQEWVRHKGDFSIKDVSFELEEGYIMCLLGRNGSGKTTLLNMIYGMLIPDSGEVLWKGKNIQKNICDFRNQVAYIGEESWCFNEKTMAENASLLSMLYKNFDQGLYEEYIKTFDLTEKDSQKTYVSLSTGQRMKFQLAFAMARRPEFMLLDEPMANLDPVIKTDLLEIIHERVAKDNMGIVISTHLVEDISDMTDYIGILENGSMKVFGDRETIFDRYNTVSLRELLLDVGGEK